MQILNLLHRIEPRPLGPQLLLLALQPPALTAPVHGVHRDLRVLPVEDDIEVVHPDGPQDGHGKPELLRTHHRQCPVPLPQIPEIVTGRRLQHPLPPLHLEVRQRREEPRRISQLVNIAEDLVSTDLLAVGLHTEGQYLLVSRIDHSRGQNDEISPRIQYNAIVPQRQRGIPDDRPIESDTPYIRRLYLPPHIEVTIHLDGQPHPPMETHVHLPHVHHRLAPRRADREQPLTPDLFVR